MHCHNITLITKFQINIFNIEYVITNNHLGVGNRRLSPKYVRVSIEYFISNIYKL